MSLLRDFISLFFPRLCAACDAALLSHEEVLCTLCWHQLPLTGFHKLDDNAVSRIFWGRVNITHAAALCYFQKGGKVQHLIHLMKYKGRKEIGEYLGKIYGKQLRDVELYRDVDVIVPVPLHRRKQRKRGFNQSEYIARGLSVSMKLPIDTKSLVRVTHSESQTRKSRLKRWENVKEIFVVKEVKTLQNKHVLLVDDVLTTGATIEACSRELLKIQGVSVSVVALASPVR
ncbi:MAG: ComF family protein [Bacteroidota bacterium]